MKAIGRLQLYSLEQHKEEEGEEGEATLMGGVGAAAAGVASNCQQELQRCEKRAVFLPWEHTCRL